MCAWWWDHLIRGNTAQMWQTRPDEHASFEEGIAMPSTQIRQDLSWWCYLYWVNIKRVKESFSAFSHSQSRNHFEVHSEPNYLGCHQHLHASQEMLGWSSDNIDSVTHLKWSLGTLSNPADLFGICLQVSSKCKPGWHAGSIYYISKRKRVVSAPLLLPLCEDLVLIGTPCSTEELSGLSG